MLAVDRCFAFRPDVVATVLDDGAILLDLQSKFFYELDATGWALAALFETGASVDDVLAQGRRWGAPREDEAAIYAMIETLIAENLISPGGPATAPLGIAAPGTWTRPTIQKQHEPLQQIMMSAFDPSVPLLE
jgi:hypothetical protein